MSMGSNRTDGGDSFLNDTPLPYSIDTSDEEQDRVDDDVHHYNQIHVTPKTNVSGNADNSNSEEQY